MPGHPKAKRGAIAAGTIVDVDETLARRLVGSKRAEFVSEKDQPSGPLNLNLSGSETTSSKPAPSSGKK